MHTTPLETKQRIEQALHAFAAGDLKQNALILLNTLGYTSNRQLDLDANTAEGFRDAFNLHNTLSAERALLGQWQTVDVLFQLTAGEITQSPQIRIFTTDRVDNSIIESYLFLAIELRPGHYTRTDLARVTREVNKQFPMPVLILFKHGPDLTFSIINRRLHKRDSSKDVLEKVTLIKDIDTTRPHRAHIEILCDLSLDELYRKHGFGNFVELHRAWQTTLDSTELNKRFFKEIADWYFWAMERVVFPEGAGADAGVRNATSLIRLITRIIFVWFLKEKGLVPDDLFNRRTLDAILTFDDPNASTYVKAILQNLFFATLNQEMNTPDTPDNRKFRHTTASGAGRSGSRDQHYMIHNVYRYARYFKDPQAALALFATIPFLNGGLFECLDKQDPDNPKQVLRIDGFSDRADNPLRVPDALFFGDEQEVDLNAIYGTSGKRYKVRGLIDILSSYKFTITENTPIEEEIALDPELLGQVFENLLAAYNPETETTARKQTGSFYTPREIVNYMVDESLVAYLNTNLTGFDTEPRLRHLLAYNEEPHTFTGDEVACLITAIDRLKILDPACGSGAFPMGILHKLVFILGKLDPDNVHWRETQRQKALRETEKAFLLGDKSEREKQLLEISEVFERNAGDYGRKLYLIENCIYGVDIQPIAVQIAKLRFFISLVVDQHVDDAQPNRGVRPLPNLETKFVAANTLLGVDKPQQTSLFDTNEIQQKEKQLKAIRAKHFTARTPHTKEKYRQEDANLRAEIAQILAQSNFPPQTIHQLANWNPYDQNTSAGFFDPEWMFGLNDGFDIVIGNPPYVRVDNISPSLKVAYKSHYKTSVGQYDLYYLFFEHSSKVLNNSGICVFITPNKFCASSSGKNLRELILKHFVRLEILSTSLLPVFEDAANYPVISSFQRLSTSDRVKTLIVRQANSLENLIESSENWYELSEAQITELPDNIIPINVKNNQVRLVLNILKKFTRLGKIFSISEGLRIPRNCETDTVTSYHIVKQYQFDRYSTIKPGSYIKEKDIQRILSPGSERYSKTFKDKILIAEDALRITATMDFENSIPQGGIYFGVLTTTRVSIESVLALLNSKFLSFVYGILFGGMHMGGGYLRYRTSFLENLPFPEIPKTKQTVLSDQVSGILAAKAADPADDVTALEAEIDRLVYQLYGLTPEEIAIVEGAR